MKTKDCFTTPNTINTKTSLLMPTQIFKDYWKRFQNLGLIVLFGLIFSLTVFDLANSQSSPLLEGENIYAQMASEQEKSDVGFLSIEFSNITIQEALEILARKVNVGFSYNPEIIPNNRIHLSMTDVPPHKIIYKLLEETNLEPVLPPSKDVIVIREKRSIGSVEIIQETITGTVIDAQTRDVLPGVNILIEGTSTGTATNVMGEFELTVESLNDTLIVSFIGYQTQSVPIDGRSELNVELQPMAVTGEDIVVTALGVARESRSLGYSTVTVSPDEMTTNRTGNFMQSLQGKVPGLNIGAISSGVGGSTELNIRGQSSFSGANSPLIVVDGVPISNQITIGGTQGPFDQADTGDGLLSIPPDIIESMSVLKGATAAALYGSRAKDGVIMITTKNNSGSRNLNVTYNSNFTMEQVIDDTDFQYEYGQGEQGVRPTSPFPMSGVWSFGEKIEPGMTQILFDGIEVPYEAQKNQLTNFYNGGYTATNTISLANGTATGGFNLTLSQLNNDGITPNSGFERYNISLGVTEDLLENLNVSGNINYSREIHTNPARMEGQEISTPKTIYTMANTMPLYLLEENQRLPDGREMPWARFEVRTNPYLSVNDHFNDVSRDRIFGNIMLRYSFTDWLYVQTRLGQDYFSRTQDLNVPSLLGGKPPAPSGFINGSVTADRRNFREINADFIIGANRDITESISMDVLVGGNRMYQHSERSSTFGEDFIVPWLYTVENTRVQTPLDQYTERAVNSLYGSLDFSYNDYLYLSFTARNDWFSTLSPDNRSILYPSVSASFVFTDLFDDLPDWLNNGTFRAAYAEVGSDVDIQPFSGVLGYNTSSALFAGPLGSQPIGSINTNTIPNPNLRPMRLKEREFGINLMIFERIGFDLTYYSKLSIDQILNASVSNTSGYSSTRVNIGESRTNGIEGYLDITAIQKSNLLWNLTLNGSYINSEVLKLGESDDAVSIGGSTRQVVGQPLGQMYRSAFLRDDQGRIVFNPNNGLPLSESEDQHLGGTLPKWIGGIANTINWKKFQFYGLIDFKLGHKIYQNNERDNVRHGKSKRTLPGRDVGCVVGEGVFPDGTANNICVPIQPYYEAIANINEFNTFDAGFIKLRQLSLGYDFTEMVSNHLPIKGLNLNFVVRNVLTIKKSTLNMDPEAISSPGQTTLSYALPMTRSYGFNLRVEL